MKIIDSTQPCEANVLRIGDMYSVQMAPTVEINGKQEQVFLCLQFEIIDGKAANITTSPEKWNEQVVKRMEPA